MIKATTKWHAVDYTPPYTVADLHTKVSGARAPPPQQDQILSFLHMFSPKSACVGGWHPLQQGLAPPQWEILDPPLLQYHRQASRGLKVQFKLSSSPAVYIAMYTYIHGNISIPWI